MGFASSKDQCFTTFKRQVFKDVKNQKSGGCGSCKTFSFSCGDSSCLREWPYCVMNVCVLILITFKLYRYIIITWINVTSYIILKNRLNLPARPCMLGGCPVVFHWMSSMSSNLMHEIIFSLESKKKSRCYQSLIWKVLHLYNPVIHTKMLLKLLNNKHQGFTSFYTPRNHYFIV